jgi:lipoprotein NlpD
MVGAGAAVLQGCASDSPAPVSSRGISSKTGDGSRPTRYRVVKGDTLYSIAWRFDLDYKQLAAWNGIRNPYRIFPNQQLRLDPPPARAKPAAPRSPQKPPAAKPAVAKAPPTAPANTASPPPAPAPAKSKPVAKPKPAAAPRKPRPPVEALDSPGWAWPTRGAVVQTFRKGDRTRQGIRIAGNFGQPIRAAATGRVVYSGSGLPGYGQLIIIKHNKNHLSAYGFNRKLLVEQGDTVAKGEQVAEMGRSTDGKSLLHFEIRHRDAALDPLTLLPRQ